MMNQLELLLVVINQNNHHFINKMNIRTPVVIANQSDHCDYFEQELDGKMVKMITTNTKGVGLNRNIGLIYSSAEILMFSDDDMVYYDDYEKIVVEEFANNSDADMIIFDIDYYNGEKKRSDVCNNEDKRLHLYNSLKYGTCSVAIRRKALLRANLSFSTLFGGGCIYSHGEDSIFITEAFKKRLNVYSSSKKIGKNINRGSSWFSGYHEKYFYDQGAMLACAFPKLKKLLQLYFIIRMRGMSQCDVYTMWKMMSKGIKNYNKLITFSEL